MFKLDKEQNSIEKINNISFKSINAMERYHLQEWIVKCPGCLNEELLIVQKEFAGFNDTNERLDLLAIDQNGTLVIIENKSDDSGKNVPWQALKYVSYCSTLTTEQIISIYQDYLDKYAAGQKAVQNISDFLNRPIDEISLNIEDQRIILIAGNYRKETTSTVMWLLNRGIKIQCFKVTLFQCEEDVFVDIEQIIPVKETEDYIIKMVDKEQSEKVVKAVNQTINNIRKEFWNRLLAKYNTMSEQFKNVNASCDHWLSSGSGIGGVSLSFVVTKRHVNIEINIDTPLKERNKDIFDKLLEKKADIENEFGDCLIWERQDDNKRSRILYKLDGVDISNRDDWDKIEEFLCKSMSKFERPFKNRLIKIKNSK